MTSWITLTAPCGTVLDLDDRINIIMETEAKGLNMPPFEFGIESLTANLSRYQQVKTGKRVLELPVILIGASISALQAQIDTINDILNPLNGDAVLTLTRPDGNQRTLTCRYLEGNEGDFGNGVYGLTWIKFTLSLQAIDPLLYTVTPVAASYSGSALGAFFPDVNDPNGSFFPMNLSASTVVGIDTITNPGSVEAWPVWTITGPGDSLVLRNNTTGKFMILPITLAAGRSIIIDTRPGHKTILLDDGITNYFPLLTLDSAIWSFARGANNIQVELNNIIVGTSTISLTFNPAYLGM